ncbi:TetR/AcrR family transcriptional regulator [Solidesulfovibrio sp.]|uniref:TetR/AcrR family transcriptional regulator n=1 Tax=Solidesulfovibrio sp. TaxID=2910990 RepID=UPI002630D621|nr:TetR/AcrR family transcriptional regulator [Solidesulfovibrio sp.]
MAERLESPLRCEQIAEAALTIVVEQGIGAVTVRRVAEAVGISAAALYRHYKNKGDILAAILEEHHEFHMANIRRALAEGRSPLDSLRIHYSGTMKLVARYRALPVIFLSDVVWFEEPRLRDLKMRHHATITDFLMDMVAKGQEQGEIRPDIRARELVNHYIGLVAMPALMCARTPEEVDMDLQTAANWEMFARAVSV